MHIYTMQEKVEVCTGNQFIIQKSAIMQTAEKTLITVENTINAPIDKVWEAWTKPEHVVKWNNASDDWHTLSALYSSYTLEFAP